MTNLRKYFYIGLTGLLTSSAISACYWQAQRYQSAAKKWKIVSKQLNQDHPDDLSKINPADLSKIYSFKYLKIKGKLSQNFIKVQRAKNGRMGYLVVRNIQYQNQFSNQIQDILALEGWCEEEYAFEPKQSSIKDQIVYKGILRQKQKSDFLHSKMKNEDIEKFKMNTFIDLKSIISKFNLKQNQINSNYYFQILKPLDSTDHDNFPYQYSIDNFQLPYLTPDKHLTYSIFWGCTSLVGLFAIIKAMKIK